MGEEIPVPPDIPVPGPSEQTIYSEENTQSVKEEPQPPDENSSEQITSNEADNKEIIIRSNMILGALNAALVLTFYLLLIIGVHAYLVKAYEINILQIVILSFTNAQMPFFADLIKFLGNLIEIFFVDSIIVGMIYAAYISNYEVRIKENTIAWKKGFLWINKQEFQLEDIEQIYTEKYTFFPSTKQLCIKALDDDIIKIPFVRNADQVKKKIIERVKLRYSELEIENNLHTPIKIANPV